MKKLSFLLIIPLILLAFKSEAQIVNAVTYDFIDGTIIASKQSVDGKLTLGGAYVYHGANYGLNLKVNQEINITVSGSCTIRFVGSQYSGLNMVGTAFVSGDLGQQVTKVLNDKVDTYDFVYSGLPTTLSFKTVAGTGNDTYLPSIQVIPVQLGIDFTAPEKNIAYYFDMRNESVVAAADPGNVTIQKGLLKIEGGCCNAYDYHGKQHGIYYKVGNKITLQVAGNSYIRLGADQYSGGIIKATTTTGTFDVTSVNNNTGSTYSDGSPLYVDFLYVGTAGTVVLESTGSTSYLPYIEISPNPDNITLTPWIQKSGSITINGTEIGFTTGADATSKASVTVTSGTVISATNEAASIQIDLGGSDLSTFIPALTGDIASVSINGEVLTITFSDPTSNPKTYNITIRDNSATIEAEPGVTYAYNFYDGSELPQTSYSALRYATFRTSDGIVTINSNSSAQALQFGYHDAVHGGVFFPDNSFDIIVAGNAIVTFIVDTYGSANDAFFEFTDSNSNILGSVAAQNIGGADGFPVNFAYTGAAGTITATLKSTLFPNAEIYLHGMSIDNAAMINSSNGKIDVWDFGAEQLDTNLYNNQLNETKINAWYGATTPGTAGVALPSFTEGALSWVGGANDRLRTTNTSLSRYDANIASVSGYTGRVYVNSDAAIGRYMSLTLSEDDEVTIFAKTDAGGKIHFQYVPNPASQEDVVTMPIDLKQLDFVAKKAGTYRVFDAIGKPSYYRILRKDAIYKALTGSVDVTQAAEIPAGFSIVFTNEAGKSWSSSVSSGVYGVNLPKGYTYGISLENANGYIIGNGNSITITESTTTYDITILAVELYTVSGNIIGVGSQISNATLIYTPTESKFYVPNPTINIGSSTYTVQLEPNVEYTISASGINDYYISANTITIGNTNTSTDVVFVSKPIYSITINAPDLDATQLSKLGLKFTNLNDASYSYSFSGVSTVALRDGIYKINYSGLDEYPLELGLNSNLTVSGANTSKILNFKPVSNWSFDDKVITNSTPYYKGLAFTGSVTNEIAKGHLNCGVGSTVKVPINPGQKMIVTYYYAANFSIDGGASIITTSGSTSTFERIEYIYPGSSSGFVTITVAGSGATYLTDIDVRTIVAYAPVITVGIDKDYQAINEALNAIAEMNRPNNERVVVMIDPGNYEEMVVIKNPNITLKNAALTPSISLLNAGVDIDINAVRITSYYGYGYHYFSQGLDNKWHADVLAINKANGYQNYENVSGTTNASYWNATLVVSSNGFVVEDIIIENSFNQYISQKESNDVVVLGNGNKGVRPVTYGSTAVQDRDFVERAAAIGIANNTDKVILNNCLVVGRQDSFFGGSNARVVVYKGAVMGAVDYIFGGMDAVFYKTDLILNTSDAASDAAYITAAQQSSGRGFLMYECHVKSTIPGVETASVNGSKPGYFGRPWLATTSEVVFYNTTIDASTYPGSVGLSLISPVGWTNSLGGESNKMYEYGTIENASGIDNSSNRVSWSRVLSSPILTHDGVAITTFNFTKGNDNWNPIADLNALGLEDYHVAETSVKVAAYNSKIYISNITSNTQVNIYSITGALVKTIKTNKDTNFDIKNGLYIVTIKDEVGAKVVKLASY